MFPSSPAADLWKNSANGWISLIAGYSGTIAIMLGETGRISSLFRSTVKAGRPADEI